MFKSLVSAVSEQRQEIKNALVLFPYFETWNPDLTAECCRVSSISEFPPGEIILGPDTGSSHTVYFVLEGVCKMVRNLNVEVKEDSCRRVMYRLNKGIAPGTFYSESKHDGYSSKLFNVMFQSQDLKFFEGSDKVEKEPEVNAKVKKEPQVNAEVKEPEERTEVKEEEEMNVEIKIKEDMPVNAEIKEKSQFQAEVKKELEVKTEEQNESVLCSEKEAEPEINAEVKGELTVTLEQKPEKAEKEREKPERNNLEAEKLSKVVGNPFENTSNINTPSTANKPENSTNFKNKSTMDKTVPSETTYEPDHHLKILEESKKRRNQTRKTFFPEKPPNVKSFFIQIGFLHRGACFGLEKFEKENYILSETAVKCLKIPEGFLLRHNPCNIWKRIRLFHSLYLPKDEMVFDRFRTDRMWLEGKKKLTDAVSGKSLSNFTLICDTPYSARLKELR